MTQTARLVRALQGHGFDTAYGFPDSLLAGLSRAFQRWPGHVVAPNEGAAIGMAIGHYLATASPAVVYMQNSGLGNVINPLVSLAQVYDTPMLLLIGWRGEMTDAGQLPDEPQHAGMGRITLRLLDLLGIPFWIVEADSDMEALVRDAAAIGAPTALVVRKAALEPVTRHPDDRELMTREDAISAVLNAAGKTPIVATTGFTSRELAAARQRRGEPGADFLTVGGMGHALALALAIADTGREVICLDGDGAALMHMGTMTIAASRTCLIHVVFVNGAHDSVGGMPTAAPGLDFAGVAAAVGYHSIFEAHDAPGIESALADPRGSTVLVVHCRCGTRPDLPRPSVAPSQTRDAFMDRLVGG